MLRSFGCSVLLCFSVAACGVASTSIYTLYRGSPGDSSARIHVATFDALEEDAYNRQNCLRVAELMMSQPGVVVKYWCEGSTQQE